MLKDFLQEAVVLIVGKQAETIADLLTSKKHVNEFLIAKKLGITINQTRNLLYKIADQGIVSSIRKKDKKKGWYTYFWKLEVIKALEFLRGDLLKKMEQISHQINSREVKQFYVCPTCHVEYTEENALLNDFTCPECGNVFVLKDNTKTIKDLRKVFDKMKKELEGIDSEVEKERSVLDKQREKEDKKLKKEKDKIRKASLKKSRLARKAKMPKVKSKKVMHKKQKKNKKKAPKKTSKKKRI